MLVEISNRFQHVSIDSIMIDLDAFLSDREKKIFIYFKLKLDLFDCFDEEIEK